MLMHHVAFPPTTPIAPMLPSPHQAYGYGGGAPLRLPPGWGNCPAFGDPIGQFVPMKVGWSTKEGLVVGGPVLFGV